MSLPHTRSEVSFNTHTYTQKENVIFNTDINHLEETSASAKMEEPFSS